MAVAGRVGRAALAWGWRAARRGAYLIGLADGLAELGTVGSLKLTPFHYASTGLMFGQGANRAPA